MFKHIMVATDGSPLSGIACAKAALLAKLVGAKLTAIHVVGRYQREFDGEGYQLPDAKLLRQRFDEAETVRAARILEEARKVASGLGIECTSTVVSGDEPYRALIDKAASYGCDLIVMASHGRRGVEGVLLGSETQKLLTHCRIPVLVCR